MKKILISIFIFCSLFSIAQKSSCGDIKSKNNDPILNKKVAAALLAGFEESSKESLLKTGSVGTKGTYFRHYFNLNTWNIEKDELGNITEKEQTVFIIYKDKNGVCREASAHVRMDHEGGGRYGEPYTNGILSDYNPKKVDCVCGDNLTDWLAGANSASYESGSSETNSGDKKPLSTKKANTGDVSKYQKPDGPYEVKDANGKPMLTGAYKGGKKQGVWKQYNDGKLMLEENYTDDVLNGMSTNYNDDGSIQSKMEFKNGVKNGIEQFFEAGGMKSNYTYLNGKKHGKCIDYYSNGSKRTEENYMDGKKDGTETSYSDKGEVSEIKTYKDDQLNGVYKKYSGGKIKEEGNYINGMKDGAWKIYDGKTGAVKDTKVYKEGAPQ